VIVTQTDLKAFDALFAEGSSSATADLVERLRKMRRAIESGEAVSREAREPLDSVVAFLACVDDRYHRLEDDPSSGWVGCD